MTVISNYLLRLVVSLFILVVSMITAFGESSTNCELNVGWEDWKPYIYKKDGQFYGPEYEYLKTLAETVGCKLIFVERPWVRALKDIEDTSIDMLYGASYTKERSDFAIFSKPYRYEEFVLLTHESIPHQKINLESWLATNNGDNTSKTIGIIRGFYYGEMLDTIMKKASVQARFNDVRSDDQLERMLAHKRIDGFIVEHVVADEMKKSNPSLNIVFIEGAQSEPMHLMFSKTTSPMIIKRFNDAITTLSIDK